LRELVPGPGQQMFWEISGHPVFRLPEYLKKYMIESDALDFLSFDKITDGFAGKKIKKGTKFTKMCLYLTILI